MLWQGHESESGQEGVKVHDMRFLKSLGCS